MSPSYFTHLCEVNEFHGRSAGHFGFLVFGFFLNKKSIAVKYWVKF